MGVSILNATFGDNIARRDVTQSIKDKAKSGTIDVTANEELIPAFEVSQETKLDNADLADITKKAQEQCNGGADSACMQATKAKLMQEKHAEKAQKDTSAANIIAGRSLQVTYLDTNNKVKRAVVPDGQKFKLEDVAFVSKGGKVEEASSWEPIKQAFSDAAGIFWWTLLFVFSVAAAYRAFKLYGNLLLAVFIGSLAVLLPLGGYSPQVGVYLIIVVYGFIEMGKMARQKAMGAAPTAMSTPSLEDPLAAFKGASSSVNDVLGNLRGANPLAALGSSDTLAGALGGLKGANPMAALGSFLGKR